jgi:hypothetical protein
MINSPPRRMVDDAIDAYVDWREECTHVWEAHRRWQSSGGRDAALAFRAYVAALDREERASEVYADLIGRVGHLVAGALPRVLADREPATEASQQ